MSRHDPDIDAVTRLVIGVARDVVLPRFRALGAGDVESKPSAGHRDDIVTVADREAEDRLSAGLADILAAPVIGEEATHADPGLLRLIDGDGPVWIVDPIDGTKAFSRGVPLYSNLITVIDEHGTLVSAINLPALAELVIAGRGLGCFRNGERCHVSDETVPERCVLTTSGYDYWPEPMLRGALASGMQMRTWGDGYGYALVATGRAEAMVDPVVAHWDVAGMDVILTEAGGRFSALDGSPRTDGGTGIGTNGLIHDDLLAQLSG